MVTINRNLNLVIPISRGETEKLYIHSTPIMPETFERYHLVLAKTFSAFAENGIVVTSAPSIAQMVLKDVATSTYRSPGLNWWDGPDGVGGEGGLLAEMVRLSNIITASGDGWTTMPLQTALDRKLIDAEEKSEVLNILTFFTVVSRVPPRADRDRLVRGMAAIYELLTTFSNATEYAASLKTSMPDEIIGENVPA